MPSLVIILDLHPFMAKISFAYFEPARMAFSLEIIFTEIIFFDNKALVMSPLPMSSARNCANCFFELNDNTMIKC